jgi:leader peptidase (prepilin peptidase)/N-methyltransferase
VATLAVTAPEIAFSVVIFVLGCCVGSFLNVCIWRMPRGLSINEPRRSFCPRCGKPIRGADNIPLLSFMLLRGKCRDCGAPISWRYPLVEAATGLLMVALYLVQRVGGGTERGQVVAMGLLCALLVVASAVDMEFLIIPDEVSLFGLLGGLAAGLLLPGLHVGDAPYHTFRSLTGLRALDGLIGSAIGAVAGGGLVLVFAVIGELIFRKEAMGFGDVKLMAMVGAFLGWKVAVLTFFIAPFFGLLYGIPILIIRKEHVMPFGPFLSAGAVLVMLVRSTACGWFDRYLDMAGQLFGAIFGR